MIKYLFLVVSILFMVSGCDKGLQGDLIFSPGNPAKGFEFPYFLFMPDGASTTQEMVLIVETNNSGFASDDFKEHVEKAKRTATKDFYIGNYISRKLKFPLLVPVFPRPLNEWKIYTHALDRDVMMQSGNSLQRIDLQLLAMTEDAKTRLAEIGYSVQQQLLIVGFSASGTFANRFTLLHPEKVLAVAAGGLNGLLMLPVTGLEGEKLNYPLGVNDFELLFGEVFDSIAFKSTPQFLFMGKLDENDAIPFEDGYESDERALVFKLLGEEMQPQRWDNCVAIYKREKVNATCITYDGIGHEHPSIIMEDILRFFQSCLEQNSQNATSTR